MNRRGMTLMELVIGIMITGMMTAAGYAAFATIVDNRTRVRQSTRAVERAAATRAAIASWLSSGRWVRDSGSVPAAFSSIGAIEEDDYIRVITSAPTPLGSQQTEVYLFIDRDPMTPETGLVADFTSLNAPEDSLLLYGGTRRMELEPSVMGLAVRYQDRTTNSWISREELGNTQPVGVHVQLFAAAGDSLPPLLMIPFVYPLGTSR